MTALKDYDRLESIGIWRESSETQRRDVAVTFGDASLIIKDKTDTALAHWSLPAVHRVNPGKRPALFKPAPDAEEELELDDNEMIDAVEKIRKTIEKRRPHSGRLRLAVSSGIVAAIVAVGFLWLPQALVRNTVAVLPESTRLAIGTTLLGHMTRLTGDTCRDTLGAAALARLKTRALQSKLRKAYVVPDLGTRDTLVLPGRLLLLDATLVEDHDSPDVAAGYMIKALTDRRDADPMTALLQQAGSKSTFRLLTTGHIDDAALKSYAETLLAQPEQPILSQPLLASLKSARVSATPFAYAVDVTGEATIELIEADPFRGADAPRLLSDGDWISLQAICTE
ncbi:hypothetical protein [uncultured Litoreibacter sp.]|uniref:hypothetical protein n=1 Tax=uncultured Litoreibacter sp. TaxID=1392394 RepID=UPI00260A6DF5|nr:hypothetical protein [uncultured Litoreibacter sp.]